MLYKIDFACAYYTTLNIDKSVKDALKQERNRWWRGVKARVRQNCNKSCRLSDHYLVQRKKLTSKIAWDTDGIRRLDGWRVG